MMIKLFSTASLVLLVIFAILVRSSNAKTKRGTLADYEAPLPSPNGYKENMTPVAFISSEDERINEGEPFWINEMFPLNQTELDKFLNTIGQQDLNYTIYEVKTDSIVTGSQPKLKVDDMNKRDILSKTDRLLIARASDSQTKAWFANYRAARFWNGLLANILVTATGLGTFIWGMYHGDRDSMVTGMGALIGSAVLSQGFQAPQWPGSVENVNGELKGPDSAKRTSESLDHLISHLGISKEEEISSIINQWEIVNRSHKHHMFSKKDELGRKQEFLFILEGATREKVQKLSKRDDQPIVYGVRYTYYYPNHDPALQAEYESSGYDADGMADFILGTMESLQSKDTCVYLDLPESVLRMAGKMELLLYDYVDTGPSYDDCVNNYPCESSSTWCTRHDEL